MASWYSILMVILIGWQLRMCSGGTGSNSISYLMEKYSDSRGVLTVNQLQQIFDNICECPLDINSTDVTEVNSFTSASGNCSYSNNLSLSAQKLFTKLDIKEGFVNISSFEDMCPVILEHLESNTCGKSPFINVSEEVKTNVPRSYQVWIVGMGCVSVINLSSVLGAFVSPFTHTSFYKKLIIVMIGLAVGSLSASSLFHLIPQAFGLVNSDSHHTYLKRALLMWIGVWIFFIIERILKMIADHKRVKQHRNSTGLETSEVISSVSNPIELLPHLQQELESLHDQVTIEQSALHNSACLHKNPGILYEYLEQAEKASVEHHEKAQATNSHGHEHVVHVEKIKGKSIATIAWMIIFGDSFHNFVDGLSIGAALNQSLLSGISISVAVFCEEVPHELGDFAVLLNSGMTVRKAMAFNCLSACTCYIGVILGILIGEIEINYYIFGFASGMFLYISLVDMVPEMNQVAAEASKVSVKVALLTLLLQNIGMLTGVAILYILARYQDSINFG